MAKGSQYVCQQCSAKETSSDMRGPKLESKSNFRYHSSYVTSTFCCITIHYHLLFFSTFSLAEDPPCDLQITA